MTENEKIEMHAQLAEHLYKLDMSDTLKKNTLIYHLFKADIIDKTARYLSGMPEENSKKAAEILAEMKINENRVSGWLEKVIKFELPHKEKYRLCNFMNINVLNAIRTSWGFGWHLEILQYICFQVEKLCKKHTENGEYASGLSISYERYGDYYKINGEYEQALKYYEKALEIRENLFKSYPEMELCAWSLSIINESLGDYYMVAGYPFSGVVKRQAQRYYERAMKIREKFHEDCPENENSAQALSIIYNKIWNYYQSEAEKEQALEFYEKYMEKFEQLYKEHPKNKVMYADSLSELYENHGNYYLSEGGE